MTITRQIIDNKPHIVTDMTYKNETVCLDLTLLNTMKTKKIIDISVIPISYESVFFKNNENIIKLIAHLKYNNTLDKIEMVAEAKKQYTDEDPEIFSIEINEEQFVNEIYNICLLEKKTIKKLPCFTQAIEKVIRQIKENALSNNILAKDNCLNYKCYLYHVDEGLIGVANRVLDNNNSTILGEFLGKPLEEYYNQDLYMDICINNDITLRSTKVRISDSISSSCSYVLLDLSSSKIARVNITYDNINMKIPEKLSIPKYNNTISINDLHTLLTTGNDPTLLEKYIKQNKPKNNAKINLNKYLIW